jgi:NAD(P)-dependent dehydrogenase (short-subunit alcohol dehydrogenase family)
MGSEPRTAIVTGADCGNAHEIAATIAFLASDAARSITGASIAADGGLTLMAAVRR